MPARNLKSVQRRRSDRGLDTQGYVSEMIATLRTLRYLDPVQDRYRRVLLHSYEQTREPARQFQAICLEVDLARVEGRTPPPVAA